MQDDDEDPRKDRRQENPSTTHKKNNNEAESALPPSSEARGHLSYCLPPTTWTYLSHHTTHETQGSSGHDMTLAPCSGAQVETQGSSGHETGSLQQ